MPNIKFIMKRPNNPFNPDGRLPSPKEKEETEGLLPAFFIILYENLHYN